MFIFLTRANWKHRIILFWVGFPLSILFTSLSASPSILNFLRWILFCIYTTLRRGWRICPLLLLYVFSTEDLRFLLFELIFSSKYKIHVWNCLLHISTRYFYFKLNMYKMKWVITPWQSLLRTITDQSSNAWQVCLLNANFVHHPHRLCLGYGPHYLLPESLQYFLTKFLLP